MSDIPSYQEFKDAWEKLLATRKIWIVMVEQHYAGEECILAVCSDEETADRFKAESKLGSDVRIYESRFNVKYPTV